MYFNFYGFIHGLIFVAIKKIDITKFKTQNETRIEFFNAVFCFESKDMLS